MLLGHVESGTLEKGIEGPFSDVFKMSRVGVVGGGPSCLRRNFGSPGFTSASCDEDKRCRAVKEAKSSISLYVTLMTDS